MLVRRFDQSSYHTKRKTRMASQRNRFMQTGRNEIRAQLGAIVVDEGLKSETNASNIILRRKKWIPNRTKSSLGSYCTSAGLHTHVIFAVRQRKK